MANQAEDAIALLDAMRRGTAVRPDVFCYNVCIGACGKVGSYERALSLLGEMRVDGITPDVVRYDTPRRPPYPQIMSACEVRS